MGLLGNRHLWPTRSVPSRSGTPDGQPGRAVPAGFRRLPDDDPDSLTVCRHGHHQAEVDATPNLAPFLGQGGPTRSRDGHPATGPKGAVVNKADFDRDDQHSLSSRRGLRRAAAPTVEGGCARDSRPGTPHRSKAVPVGRPARTGWERPPVLPRRHRAASAPLNCPNPAPSMRPYVPAGNSRRYPEGDTDAVAHRRDAQALPMHLAPAATLAAPDITRTGRLIRRYRPSHLLEIEARTAAVLPTTEVRRELNTRPGLRAQARAELSRAVRLRWADSRHSKRPCSRPSGSSTSPPSVRKRSPKELTRV